MVGREEWTPLEESLGVQEDGCGHREGLERWLGCFTSRRKTIGLQREAGTEHTDLPWQGSCGFPAPSLRLRARAIIQDSQCGLLGTT